LRLFTIYLVLFCVYLPFAKGQKDIVCPHIDFYQKKVIKKFAQLKKKAYLCSRYPENNLFTLKGLIPIEDRSDWL